MPTIGIRPTGYPFSLFFGLNDEAARTDCDPDEWAVMQALLRKRKKRKRRQGL